MNSGELFKGINYKIIGAMPENISGVEDVWVRYVKIFISAKIRK